MADRAISELRFSGQRPCDLPTLPHTSNAARYRGGDGELPGVRQGHGRGSLSPLRGRNPDKRARRDSRVRQSFAPRLGNSRPRQQRSALRPSTPPGTARVEAEAGAAASLESRADPTREKAAPPGARPSTPERARPRRRSEDASAHAAPGDPKAALGSQVDCRDRARGGSLRADRGARSLASTQASRRQRLGHVRRGWKASRRVSLQRLRCGLRAHSARNDDTASGPAAVRWWALSR
jgi:hypothetical protein